MSENTNTKSTKIFGTVGYAGEMADPNIGNAWIAIKIADEDVVLATAPVDSISIKQAVDKIVLKSLGADFLVSTFGDNPADINITGLSLHNTTCEDKDTADNILAWYAANKLSTDTSKRILISITTGNTTQTFTCVLDTMTISGGQDERKFGVMTYSMHLYGIPVT